MNCLEMTNCLFLTVVGAHKPKDSRLGNRCTFWSNTSQFVSVNMGTFVVKKFDQLKMKKVMIVWMYIGNESSLSVQ